jgi:uncharacterized protein YjbJ (UPF0337 family)
MKNIAKGHWQRLKGALIARWGALTGDHLRVVAGRHQQIAGRLHIAYGVAQRELGRQLASIKRRSQSARS